MAQQPKILNFLRVEMAAGILSSPTPQPQLLCSFSVHSKLRFRNLTHQPQQSWLGPAPISTRSAKKQLPVAVAMQEPLLSSSSALVEHISNSRQNSESFYLLAESVGYSLASYYTSLGLFVISVPGLWSLIKRSAKSKVRVLC